jgi:hypothetical protein
LAETATQKFKIRFFLLVRLRFSCNKLISTLTKMTWVLEKNRQFLFLFKTTIQDN